MIGQQIKRLTAQSAMYGLGGLISRVIAVLLLPLYTHYLPPNSYGRVELVTAATAVLAIVLQMGISSAFFRFYFDTKDPASRLTVVRKSTETPREMAVTAGRRLASVTGEATITALPSELVSAYYRVRFGKGRLDKVESEAIEQALKKIELAVQRARSFPPHFSQPGR